MDKYHQDGCETGRGQDRGKIEWKLPEVNTRAVSRRQNLLTGEFKVVARGVISIGGLIMKYTYIPTVIKRTLVKCGMNCDQKW